jgi:hypothetical protein
MFAVVDPGTVNLCVGFLFVDPETNIAKYTTVKMDMEQQYNPAQGKVQKVQYENSLLEVFIERMINEFWDKYWSRVKYCGIERQRKGRQKRDFILLSYILKLQLERRNIKVIYTSRGWLIAIAISATHSGKQKTNNNKGIFYFPTVSARA